MYWKSGAVGLFGWVFLGTASAAEMLTLVDQGKAFRVPINVLFINGADYAVKVLSGYDGPPLADGAKVVIEGGERLLFPGQIVKVVQARIGKAD